MIGHQHTAGIVPASITTLAADAQAVIRTAKTLSNHPTRVLSCFISYRYPNLSWSECEFVANHVKYLEKA